MKEILQEIQELAQDIHRKTLAANGTIEGVQNQLNKAQPEITASTEFQYQSKTFSYFSNDIVFPIFTKNPIL